MKTFLKRVMILGILGGIGYFISKKFCKKDDCCCKK
jgi:hypothetical protein